jgi:hypothetical protein
MFLALFLVGMGQTIDNRDLQYYRTPGKKGVNVFETSKDNSVEFNGVQTRLGGDFDMIFQGLDQTNQWDPDGDGIANEGLANLSNNFSLPTANLNLDVQLEDGLRLHMRTYLSSRHHTESYVKGGYIQMDKLDFVSPGFLSGLMDYTYIKIGMDQINYGDVQFRRTDNAMSIYNPFISNYIMDAFTTEPFLEVTYQNNGFLGVVGVTNGRLNQSPTSGDNGHAKYLKVGYDNHETSGMRLRFTASVYNSSDLGTRDYIYGGDRAGGKYYSILNSESDFEPRVNPRFPYQTSFQLNPFVKMGGLEFFGVYEIANNGDDEIGGSFTQMGGELLYRFGSNEGMYVGGRYNRVSGDVSDEAEPIKINRLNVGGGWFMTDNALIKVEYVSQQNKGNGYYNSVYYRADVSGINLAATISF